MTDLNVKRKTIKPENHTEENLEDLGHGDEVLGTTPKTGSMKEIIHKLDFIKIKQFCSAKGTIQRMWRQSHKLEENICKRQIW